MLAKRFRMCESEVTKVVRKQRPFFYGNTALRSAWNKQKHTRFAIILSGKVCRTSVCRNWYRRKFYSLVRPYLASSLDIVFQIQKKVLDHNDLAHKQVFESEILHHLHLLLWKTN